MFWKRGAGKKRKLPIPVAGIGMLLILVAAAACAAPASKQADKPTSAMPLPEIEAARRAMEGYTGDTEMVFADPVVAMLIRGMLGKAEGDSVTVREMQTIRSFEYPGAEDKLFDADQDRMHFFNSHRIKTLEDFRYCENLESLTVRMQEVDSVECLKDLKKLNSIVLSMCRISDLSPLAEMESLHTLFVYHNPITSIDCLRNQKSIVSLDIRCCPVRDFSPLAGMESLQSLHIGNKPHTADSFENWLNSLLNIRGYDISSLQDSSGLVYFSCNGKLKDIAPLLGHKGLREVELNGLRNEDFAALLKNCRELECVNLEDSTVKFSSFSLIGEKLRMLSISRSAVICDVSELPCPRNLDMLFLSNNHIKDISPLSKYTSLTLLNIGSNNIKDITPLAGLTNLKFLDLHGNQIKDFGVLKDLRALKSVNVADNPYTDDAVFKLLEERGCEVEYEWP